MNYTLKIIFKKIKNKYKERETNSPKTWPELNVQVSGESQFRPIMLGWFSGRLWNWPNPESA